MIRTSPFHARTSALNETGLWSHWSGHLAAEKYGLSDKFEYFAVRNAAGIFDTSPLFKYRFSGPGAEAFLAGVLARDPRTLAPGHGMYAIWCDDRGFVVEDGVLLRHAKDEFVLTAAEPNLAYFQDLVTRRDKVVIEEVSEDWAVLSIQGPRARRILAGLSTRASRRCRTSGSPRARPAAARSRSRGRATPATSATRSGSSAENALPAWDAIWEATRGMGVLPFGMQALYMTRIEAGLLLLDVDFANSRFAWTDADRATPHELGLGLDAQGRRDRRSRVHRPRRDPARARGQGRPASGPPGSSSTGATGTASTTRPASSRPRTTRRSRRRCSCTTPTASRSASRRASCTRRCSSGTSGSAGCPVESAKAGSRVYLEVPVSHRYVHVAAETARLPLYNPERRTA